MRKYIYRVIGWPSDLYRNWFEVHHVVPRELGGSNHMDNLTTLCVPCHKDENRRQAKERAARRRIAA
jgi:5-methylcytosine-specific restriction endonuclease McrA